MESNGIKFQSEDYYFNLKLKNIRKGIFTFKDIGNILWKKKIESILLDDIEKGISTDVAKKVLIDYKIDQINKQQITIDDVSPLIRDDVIRQIKNDEIV